MDNDEEDSFQRLLLQLEAAKAAYDASLLERKYSNQTILGRGFGGVEEQIVRHAIKNMFVPLVLQWSSALAAVKKVIEKDDVLWQSWWLRDFKHFTTQSGKDLPKWITHEFNCEGISIIKVIDDERYARVPWRRYYCWCVFFRRRMLAWYAHVWVKTHDPDSWAVRRILDEVPKFNIRRRKPYRVIADVDNVEDQKYFVGSYTIAPYNLPYGELLLFTNFKGKSMVISAYDLNRQDSRLTENTLEERKRLYEEAMERDESFMEHAILSLHEILLKKSLFPFPDAIHLSDGRTLLPNDNMNINHDETLTLLCRWYFHDTVLRARGRELLPASERLLALQQLSKLPAAPMVFDDEGQGVLFVGDACIRCQTQRPIMYECMRCNVATYCSEVCSQLNWPKHKQDCKP